MLGLVGGRNYIEFGNFGSKQTCNQILYSQFKVELIYKKARSSSTTISSSALYAIKPRFDYHWLNINSMNQNFIKPNDNKKPLFLEFSRQFVLNLGMTRVCRFRIASLWRQEIERTQL